MTKAHLIFELWQIQMKTLIMLILLLKMAEMKVGKMKLPKTIINRCNTRSQYLCMPSRAMPVSYKA